jgi:hypothetical protein
MKNKFLLTFTLFLLISIPINNTFSQQLYKSFEVPGGGSGNTSTSVDSKDNTFLYVVGGAVLVGIVVYALLKNKKENPKEDTTAVILNDEFLAKNISFNDKVSNLRSQIPINISIGMQAEGIIKDEKRYYIGLSYKF